MLKSRLICHPETPCPAINDFYVEMGLDLKGNLSLRYRLAGDLSRIRIPLSQPPAAVDGLWQHTCFEAFIAVENEQSYHEFNCSPSGQYAMYAFSGYRIRAEGMSGYAPSIRFSKANNSCELQALIAETNLPTNWAGQPFQLGLSAVIELHDGSLSYWALHHPSEHPDFHHRDGWILSINRSEFS